MKRDEMRGLKFLLILFLLAGSASLRAQHYLGVRGGYSGGLIRLQPVGSYDPGVQWGLYSGGFSWKFYSEQKVIGGIQLDLQYTGKGYMYRTRLDGDTTYHRTISAVELPFMWQPHFYVAQRKVRVFMNLGVSFAYHFNSQHWYRSTEKGIFDKETYEMKLVRDNRFGYGLTGGFGFSVLAGRWDFALEARYTLGFSDILRNTDIYEYNPRRSPVDQINISIGGYYRLGKDGIRAAPSPRMEQRMAEAEARRLLRHREEGEEPVREALSPLDSILRQEAVDSVLQRRIDSLMSLPGPGAGMPVPEPAEPTETSLPEPGAGEGAKPEPPAGETLLPAETLKSETP